MILSAVPKNTFAPSACPRYNLLDVDESFFGCCAFIGETETAQK